MAHHSGNFGTSGSGANTNLGSLGANTSPLSSNMMPNVTAAAAQTPPFGAANMPPGGQVGTLAATAGRRGSEVLVLFILLVIIMCLCRDHVR